MALKTKYEVRREIKNKAYDNNNTHNFISENLLSLVQDIPHSNLGVYYPMLNEIDITSIFKQLNHLCLPKMNNNELFFTRFKPFDTMLIKNTFGFFETDNSDIIYPELVIAPGLAFNIKGGRIGRGMGHYDKYFSKNKVITIGVCYETSLYEDFEQETFDVQMNYIVTDKRIIICT